MSFSVYFDESNKIDKNSSDLYSYYGAIGCDSQTSDVINNIDVDPNIEMHFVKFKLKDMNIYMKVLEEVFKTEFYFNVYVVHSQEAFRVINYIKVNEDLLRPLLYIKIPERLIYGITRNINPLNRVDIYIDQNDEYGKYDLEKKLEDQLNAQSIYRKLNYSINEVKQLNSKDDRMLQVADVILGIVSFLFESKYLNPQPFLPAKKFNRIREQLTGDDLIFFEKSYGAEKNDVRRCLLKENNEHLEKIFLNADSLFQSGENIAKSEFIYNLLSKKENLLKLYETILYIWNENVELNNSLTAYPINNYFNEVHKESFSKYIAQFFHFKSLFDGKYKTKILQIYKAHNNEMLSEDKYVQELDFPKNLNLLVRRYLKDLQITTLNNKKIEQNIPIIS